MRRYIGYHDFYSTAIASPVLLSLRAERGNLGGVPDCFGTDVPRNDGKGCYCECSELISLAENTK